MVKWEAVYSPAEPDGYPADIWGRMTGSIDKTVAQYWKENYDIRHKLQEFLGYTHGPYYGGYVTTFASLRRTGNISNEDLLVEMAEYLKPRVSDERLQSPAWHRPATQITAPCS